MVGELNGGPKFPCYEARQLEASTVVLEFPTLADLGRAPLSPQQADSLVDKLDRQVLIKLAQLLLDDQIADGFHQAGTFLKWQEAVQPLSRFPKDQHVAILKREISYLRQLVAAV